MRRIAALAAALGAAATALIAVAADRLFPPPLDRAGDISRLAYDRDGRPLAAFSNSSRRWRFSVDLDEIDPEFVRRLLLIEDARFFRHPGVDLAAVARAGAQAVRRGRVVSGASTITMQTARLLEPRPRTFASKAIEVVRALQMEARLSKQEILELYLTLAPYGGNLEGVRAASLAYFGAEPGELDDAQQLLLIALPQAPEARRPDRRPDAAVAARRAIASRLASAGACDAGCVAAARSAPAPTRAALPQSAPDAARRALAGSSSAFVRTTINADLQRSAEGVARRHAEAAGRDVQAAVVVVDIATREVIAHVGAVGRDRPGGWMDLTAAARSPGSALKPFIYAMAFDEGLAAPEALVTDAPTDFAGYRPENFSRVHFGETTARDALRHSLNVPAVGLLDRVGAERFYGRLAAAGRALRLPTRPDPGPSLPIALGGAGATVEDLAALYAALGDGGVARPLRWIAGPSSAGPPQGAQYALFSHAAAARVLRILEDAPTPPGRTPSALSRSGARFAFKTGTSWGFRDAWAAGVGEGVAVVVWIGRADGAPRPGATGLSVAAPMLFDLFEVAADRLGGAETPSAPVLAFADPTRAEKPAAPRLVFPRDGVDVVFDRRGRRPVVLVARGGSGELGWYVDGEHVGSGARVEWRPDEPGWRRATVIDADGRSATALVRVRISGSS